MTAADAVRAIAQLTELRQRQATLAGLPASTQTEIRAALRWLGEQQTVIPARDRIPYALLRVFDAIRDDAIPTIQRADLDVLSTFASSLTSTTSRPGARR